MARRRRRRNSKYWIQEAVKRPGRCRRYLKRLYSQRKIKTYPFKKDGTIKVKAVNEAIKYVKEHVKGARRKSLLSMLNLCKRFVRGL